MPSQFLQSARIETICMTKLGITQHSTPPFAALVNVTLFNSSVSDPNIQFGGLGENEDIYATNELPHPQKGTLSATNVERSSFVASSLPHPHISLVPLFEHLIPFSDDCSVAKNSSLFDMLPHIVVVNPNILVLVADGHISYPTSQID